MTTWKRYVAMTAAAILLAVTAQAQVRQRAHSHWPGYSMEKEVTVQGEVAKVIQMERGFHRGVHLEVTAEDGVVYGVRLGPSWYLAEKGASFNTGDQVRITGATFAGPSGPVLIARKVTSEDGSLVLRNYRGERLWMWPYWRPYEGIWEIG